MTLTPILKKIIARGLSVIILLFCCFVLSGCDSSSPYQEGYDEGYEGKEKGLRYNFDNQFMAGYEAGANDSYYHSLGYQDAQGDDDPQFPSIDAYMAGYRAGKE